MAFHQAKNALTSIILLGAVTCGSHTTQHPAFGQIALTTQTVQAADQLAQLAGRPA